jgi:hypothetical protein
LGWILRLIVITAQKDVSTDLRADAGYNQPLARHFELFLYVRCANVYGRKVSMGFRKKGGLVEASKVVDVVGDAWPRRRSDYDKMSEVWR